MTSEYEHLTNADVMSAAELAEYDRDAEFRLDAEQEARDAQEQEQAAENVAEPEGECIPELIDGTVVGCGVCEDCQNAQQDADDDEIEWEAS